MHKQFIKLLLFGALYISASIISSLEAKTQHSLDSARLQQAGDLLSSKNYIKGYISFKSMAKHGCPYSQCILGIMHQNGVGTRKSTVRAQYWLQKSAQQGFADAEHRLGLMYYHGDGVKKNLKLAKLWLGKAANQGVEEAKELLAKIPGENQITNQIAQTPQELSGTADNLRTAWQGYSEVAKQLNQLSSAGQSH